MHFLNDFLKIQEVSGQATPPALYAGASGPVQRAKVCEEFAIAYVLCIGEFRTFSIIGSLSSVLRPTPTASATTHRQQW